METMTSMKMGLDTQRILLLQMAIPFYNYIYNHVSSTVILQLCLVSVYWVHTTI